MLVIFGDVVCDCITWFNCTVHDRSVKSRMSEETTCYRPYVHEKKSCKKTDDPREVTCLMCMERLQATGKYEIRLIKKSTDSYEELVPISYAWALGFERLARGERQSFELTASWSAITFIMLAVALAVPTFGTIILIFSTQVVLSITLCGAFISARKTHKLQKARLDRWEGGIDRK